MRLAGLRNRVDIEQAAPSVILVRFDGVKDGWQQWLLLTSDRHHDNIHADHDLEKLHLEMVMERDAIIIDIGDLFCAMQGRGDPRGNYDALRPEHKTAKYLDALVDTAARFYAPYADHWVLLGRGNHESSVEERMGTNLTDRLAAELRKQKDCAVIAAGYCGWIRFQFTIHKTVTKSLRLYWHHGSGASAPMTFGSLSVRRQASYIDSDIVVNGHTHDGYVIPLAREKLTDGNRVARDVTWFLRTMTYKDEWTSERDGWSIRKGGGPKPLGCIWGRFLFDGKSDIAVEFTQDAR